MQRQNRKVAGSADRVLTDPDFASHWPSLWEHLTAVKWDDGSPRRTSSLLVFSQDGVLKGMLRDQEAALCLWVAGATYQGLLDALEAGCCDPDTEWRQDRLKAGDTAKRVRKNS